VSGEMPIDADYRFSHYGWQWGWATWRRAWAHFDLKMQSWPEFKKNQLHNGAAFYKDRIDVFDEMYAGKCDTWDFQWSYAVASNYGLSIVPQYSLVKNLGIGFDCTHGTERHESQDQKVLVRPIVFPMVHPRFVMVDTLFDQLLIKKFRKSFFDNMKDYIKRFL
jgi:hypothetical protein